QTLQLARQQLEKAVELGPVTAVMYEDLGAVLEQLGQIPKAVEAYDEALKLAPDDIKTLVKRGWARADLKPPQFDEALEDFQAALKKEPGHGEANAGLAYIQACRKAPGEARRAVAKALLHGAGDYLVLHNVACAFAKLSQNDADRAKEYEDTTID